MKRVNAICSFPNTNIDLYDMVQYYSNALGETHFHGQRDISAEELPAELKAAYDAIWSADYDSLCYLADFDGNFGLYLVREFETDIDYAGTDLKKARKIADRIFDKFGEVSVILGDQTGAGECHELIVFVPWNTEKGKVLEIDAELWKA